MRLSPLNIKRQEFSKKMKGYDIKEVDAFLERVAEDVDLLQKENEDLKADLEKATTKIAEYRKIEKNLQDTLLKAQETSARSLESAKKQTNLLVKEAEIKAGLIIEKAKVYANEIRSSVEKLREEKDILVAKLRAIVNSQINIIDRTFNEDEKQIEINPSKPVQHSIDIDINDIINKISE